MIDEPPAAERPASSYDEIAHDLQVLRFAAGDISYAEIVRRIAAHRELGGVDAGNARPARTTVYDAFRTGRTRVNPQLVGEIARVLGASEAEVAQWEHRCLHARRNPREVPAAMPDAEAEPATPQSAVAEAAVPARRRKLMLLLACVCLNVLGFTLVAWLGLPLYFDMVGTAIVAIVLGPWAGVAVGLTTNAIGLAITDSSSIAFALVNIAGALVWGYGARRLRLCQTFPRYVLLNVLVALSCSLVASALLVLLFNGGTGHASESTTRNLAAMGNSLYLAVLGSNLVHSLADKLLTGFVVLGALGAVRRWIEVPFYEALSTDVKLLLKAVGDPARNAGPGSRRWQAPLPVRVAGPDPGRNESESTADKP
ncbi:ECF transporter S component [Paeniglutamicibacter sulfureus]|uniref:ECF transporter S component n=1 Tax=Paeniglutamicibacter sulfureus TaxID=43666 RepID=UPI002666C35B|nr:ECF transporter S component [Paeniglutamicibacter sulfureus]MDO2933816.1 ECF transporter S component [Paeniglutamicibacter sulfureus]